MTRCLRPQALATRARQGTVQLFLQHRLDEAAHPFANAVRNRIKPVVEKMELRMRWAMQVRTAVCGKIALIASRKPFRPSTTAMSMSSTAWFFSSFSTRSRVSLECQKFSPRIASFLLPQGDWRPS